jgi:MscS family membrane protein
VRLDKVGRPCPVGVQVLLLLGVALNIAPSIAGRTSPALPGASASAAGSAAASKSADPLNRTTPQSAVLAFLDACHSKNYQRALHYLDLDKIPSEQRAEQGPELARELEEVLNRDAQFDVATLSHDPEGDRDDGLAINRELLTSIPLDGKAVELELERKELRPGIPIWRVAPDSVALIPELAAGFSESHIERHLPAPLVNYKLLDTAIWRWIALCLLAIVIGLLSRWLSKGLLLCVTPVLKRITPNGNWQLLPLLLGPLQLLLCAAVFGAGVQWVDPSAVLRLYLGRSLALLSVLGLVWLAARILDFGLVRLGTALEGAHHTLSRSVLPLVSRVTKILILILGVIGVLSSWGYQMTTLLAGLGIGGVAIALAAQKTIENLFGSIAVVSDRPVFVGDFCKFGNSLGTVEDIGLRSTRIRTVDRTLVTVPNGQFSLMTLENFSRRDKTLLHFTLNLRRDTTPGQVREVLQAIQQILKDPGIEAGPVPGRFIGVGQYSLDIEIFAYVLTVDGDEFLKIQQDLLLRILDAVAAAGTALALPTQASVDYSVAPRQEGSGGQPSNGQPSAGQPSAGQPAPVSSSQLNGYSR